MTSSLTVFNTAGSRAVHRSPPAAPAPSCSCSPSLSPRGWSPPAPAASTTPRGRRRPRGRARHDRRSWPTSSRTWRATNPSLGQRRQKWGDQEDRARPGLSIPILQYLHPHITSIILISVFCYHISGELSIPYLYLPFLLFWKLHLKKYFIGGPDLGQQEPRRRGGWRTAWACRDWWRTATPPARPRPRPD